MLSGGSRSNAILHFSGVSIPQTTYISAGQLRWGPRREHPFFRKSFEKKDSPLVERDLGFDRRAQRSFDRAERSGNAGGA